MAGLHGRELEGRTTEGDTRERERLHELFQVPSGLCGGDGRTGFSSGWAGGGRKEEEAVPSMAEKRFAEKRGRCRKLKKKKNFIFYSTSKTCKMHATCFEITEYFLG